MTHLFIFQIGPVQSFIAAARRTQDLLVGSKILSTLATAGVQAAMQSRNHQSIFPSPADGKLPAGVPHRFAFISDEEPQAVADAVKNAITDTWKKQFVGRVHDWLVRQIGGGDWEEVYDQQTASWLEFNWIAVRYDTGDHSTSYAQAAKAMASRRNTRQFQQIEETGWKCTLTGAGALPLAGYGASRKELVEAWDTLRERVGEIVLRPNEMLGAIALIKRFAGPHHANCLPGIDTFPSTDEIAGGSRNLRDEETNGGKETANYLAVLHMDGDRMGETISKCKTLKAHQEFSRKLAKFADETVPEIISKYDEYDGSQQRTALVYAGGDDVLALLPLGVALQVADELRQGFAEVTGGHASAGIAITPYDLPLDTALERSRGAEKSAKDDFGRNAVVVTEAHGTGQVRSAGAKWDSGNTTIAEVVNTLIAHFKAREISGKLGYDIQDMIAELADIPHFAEARKADLKRLLGRRVTEQVKGKEREDIINTLTEQLSALGEAEFCGWDSLANWVIMARFLATGGKSE